MAVPHSPDVAAHIAVPCEGTAFGQLPVGSGLCCLGTPVPGHGGSFSLQKHCPEALNLWPCCSSPHRALPQALIVGSSCLKSPRSLGTKGCLMLPGCGGLAINLRAAPAIPSGAGFLRVSRSSLLRMAFSPLRRLRLHLGAKGTVCLQPPDPEVRTPFSPWSLPLLLLSQPEVQNRSGSSAAALAARSGLTRGSFGWLCEVLRDP